MTADPNILQKQNAFLIGDTYSMFPNNQMQFDNRRLNDGINYGVYTNLTGRTSIQIKFDQDGLPAGPE